MRKPKPTPVIKKHPMEAKAPVERRQCTAKSKQSGERCKRQPSIGLDVCAMHGGKSRKGMASPTFKDGKHSKYLYLPKQLIARTEEITTDAMENIVDSLAIQKALETQLLEKLGTGESGEAWIKLGQSVKDYEAAQALAKNKQALARANAFRVIRSTVEGGLSEAFLRRDIQSIQESQRKLTESLTKCRKEIQETYTQEQWNIMLNLILLSIQKHVKDAATIQNITDELDAYRRNRREPALLVAKSA